MERNLDWMTSRFVQDFANVGINGLTTDSQSLTNERELYQTAEGVDEQFDVDSLIACNSEMNPNVDSAGTDIDNSGNFGFDSAVNSQNNLRNLGSIVKPKTRDVVDPVFDPLDGSLIAQQSGSSKGPLKKDFDPEIDHDLGINVKSDLDTVTSTMSDSKREGKGVKDGNMAAPKLLSPDTTEDLLSFKKRDQKRRPKPKDGTSLFCAICGDRALGYNFDAITCESCKAFFRRNALKTKVFACSFEGNCKLDPHTRKFCSGCRLKKCFEVGMKKDWILSDDQLAKRRKKSRSCDEKYIMQPEYLTQGAVSQQQQHSPQSSEYTNVTPYPLQNTEVFNKTVVPCLPQGGITNSDGEVSTSYLSESTDNSLNSPGNQSFNFSPSQVKVEPCPEDMPRPMPPEIETALAELEKEYKGVFDSGYSELQAKKMVERPHSANELFNMTDIFIRRLIKFAKHIPEFKCLKQEDQIYLLKGGIMEIMVLRSAMGFDPRKLQWKLKQLEGVKEHGVDPNIIKEQLGQGMYSSHMSFVTSLHELTMSDNTIMTLLFVIQIFSPERQNIANKEEVMRAQDKFTLWLRVYLESILPISEAKSLYPKLIAKMLEVQKLGESSSKLASHLDITKLEPLLIEVFNLQK